MTTQGGHRSADQLPPVRPVRGNSTAATSADGRARFPDAHPHLPPMVAYTVCHGRAAGRAGAIGPTVITVAGSSTKTIARPVTPGN
jgi:hypothetical protein